eukprot:SAG22_NODE_133_length_18379_cov_34.571937_9_plen_247_part_00
MAAAGSGTPRRTRWRGSPNPCWLRVSRTIVGPESRPLRELRRARSCGFGVIEAEVSARRAAFAYVLRRFVARRMRAGFSLMVPIVWNRGGLLSTMLRNFPAKDEETLLTEEQKRSLTRKFDVWNEAWLAYLSAGTRFGDFRSAVHGHEHHAKGLHPAPIGGLAGGRADACRLCFRWQWGGTQEGTVAAGQHGTAVVEAFGAAKGLRDVDGKLLLEVEKFAVDGFSAENLGHMTTERARGPNDQQQR